MNNLQILLVQGQEFTAHMDSLARLRINVLREWPYLYDGSLDSERKYLKNYAQSPHAIAFLATHDDQIVGASTALPLIEANAAFQSAFSKNHQYELEEIYYYGESVLLPAFRGRGIGKRFFREREAQAKAHGARYACFCAIERSVGDPRCPPDYRPLHDFWARQGFKKEAKITATFDWREIGDEVDSTHRLSFWLKHLYPTTP